MPDNCHAEVFEIVGVQAKQNVSVDRVLAKGGFILAQTEVPEPNPDIRRSPPLRQLGYSPAQHCVKRGTMASGANSEANGLAQPPPSTEDRFLALPARSEDRSGTAAMGPICHVRQADGEWPVLRIGDDLDRP